MTNGEIDSMNFWDGSSRVIFSGNNVTFSGVKPSELELRYLTHVTKKLVPGRWVFWLIALLPVDG